MRIAVAGGTGFLGRALTARLRGAGHDVVALSRRPRPGASNQVAWTPDGSTGPWTAALTGVGAIVNLAGTGIADARWTAARKAALRDSRLLATRSLVVALEALAPRPTLVNASGIGYYGDRGDAVVDESSSPGTDFLALLCVDWEAEAERAAASTRVVLIRSGLVLHPAGGALKRMRLPFRLGLGGRLGSGRQYFPWIHLDDWTGLVQWTIESAQAHGPFNAAAPGVVTNAEFTRALAAALNRPAVVPVPAFALRIALGELADSLLTGQRAVPARAQEMGFEFRHQRIEEALREMLR